MILSKQNLLIVQVAAVDKAIPVLDNIHITQDGTSVASNGKVLVAVSPVIRELKEKIPLKETKAKHSVTISSETVKEVIKNMPKDLLFHGLLEHVELNVQDNTFLLSDGKRKRNIIARLYQRAFINFQEIFKRAGKSPVSTRFVINRKRLINILQTIDKICPDSSGESPVFIELNEAGNVILKGRNNKGQRVLSVMSTYKGVEGSWMEDSSWEKKLLGRRRAKKRELKKS